MAAHSIARMCWGMNITPSGRGLCSHRCSTCPSVGSAKRAGVSIAIKVCCISHAFLAPHIDEPPLHNASPSGKKAAVVVGLIGCILEKRSRYPASSTSVRLLTLTVRQHLTQSALLRQMQNGCKTFAKIYNEIAPTPSN